RLFFFFSSRRRHTRFSRDWSSDVCSSDLISSRKKRKEETQTTPLAGNSTLPDGASLFQANCAVCHQPDGRGLPGAFPPLAGSPRSEERRVGKDCSTRSSKWHTKTKMAEEE